MVDLNKSIEELENDYWGEPTHDTYIIVTCHEARQKPIESLSDEEIRCLIGQKIGLKYLLPIAIEMLADDPLVCVTHFEGDLLLALLRLDARDWADNQDELKNLKKIIQDNISDIEVSEEIPSELLENYK
jgi:hypothetical protein